MLNGNDLAILHSVGEYTETFRTKGMGYKLQQGARAWGPLSNSWGLLHKSHSSCCVKIQNYPMPELVKTIANILGIA